MLGIVPLHEHAVDMANGTADQRGQSGTVMITMDFGISPGCYQVEGVKTLNYSGNSVVK